MLRRLLSTTNARENANSVLVILSSYIPRNIRETGKFYEHEISSVLAIDIVELKIHIFHSETLLAEMQRRERRWCIVTRARRREWRLKSRDRRGRFIQSVRFDPIAVWQTPAITFDTSYTCIAPRSHPPFYPFLRLHRVIYPRFHKSLQKNCRFRPSSPRLLAKYVHRIVSCHRFRRLFIERDRTHQRAR